MSRRRPKKSFDLQPQSQNWNALHTAFFHVSRSKLLRQKIDCGYNDAGMYFTGRYEIRGNEVWMTLTPEVRTFQKGTGKLVNVVRHTNLQASVKAWAKISAREFLAGIEEIDTQEEEAAA